MSSKASIICNRDDCRAWKAPHLCSALVEVENEGKECAFYKTVSQYELERETLKKNGHTIMTPKEYAEAHSCTQ